MLLQDKYAIWPHQLKDRFVDLKGPQ